MSSPIPSFCSPSAVLCVCMGVGKQGGVWVRCKTNGHTYVRASIRVRGMTLQTRGMTLQTHKIHR
jgi:hypothetical protein